MRILLSAVLPVLLGLASPADATGQTLGSSARAVSERQVLEAEYSRSDSGARILTRALSGADVRVQRLAARALGRFERPDLTAGLVLMLVARDSLVRAEAVNAVAQSGAAYPFHELLGAERSGFVRGVIHESIGRVRATPDSAEALLVRGLADTALDARAGAARGLESLLRRTARTARPAAATLIALRRAAGEPARSPIAAEMRQNALLALAAAGDRDSATVEAALRDPSDGVRRVAVSLARRPVDDPSYIVRLQALRYAGTCERFIAATADSSEHVILAALDSLGGRPCDTGVLVRHADRGRTWRMRAHAIVSLARIAPDSARARARTLASSPVWQARVYAANAARLLRDSATLRTLADDREPNVIIAAMTSPDEALRALARDHSGLVMAAVDLLAGDPPGAAPLPPRVVDAMRNTLDRLSRTGPVTTRDPRMKLLAALAKSGDSTRVLPTARRLLGDKDPAIAGAAAAIATSMSGTPHRATTTRYEPPPLPADSYMRALRGATAQLRIRGVGTVEMALLMDDAPVAAATFASLAESGDFDGLTFHRIVPNFVVQGGSPGADEYDALTSWFMRDEVGLARNARGTFGVSTRGRDTGDGQIYINLIDNFRLDHDYTVFARTVRGLDVVDRIQEGDEIESIRIIRPGNR